MKQLLQEPYNGINTVNIQRESRVSGYDACDSAQLNFLPTVL
jgi:hypothetical protein